MAAKAVQDKSREIHLWVLLHERMPAPDTRLFHALVTDVLDRSFGVVVLDVGLERRVPCAEIPRIQRFEHDPESDALTLFLASTSVP